jgi:hypothetical protein
MKVLINRFWNRIEICCNDKAIIIHDMIYPIYRDYHIEDLKEFKEDADNLVVLEGDVSEHFLFSGVDGEYIYLDTNVDTGEIELWGTDGKRNSGLDCYAEYKNDKWYVA